MPEAVAQAERAGGAVGGRGRKGSRAPGVPEPQVVQVVLATGSTDVRLAELEPEDGLLLLWQLSQDDEGQVEVGNKASIKLASIGGASQVDTGVRLHACGPSARALLWLNFSDASLASTWADALCKHALGSQVVTAGGGDTERSDGAAGAAPGTESAQVHKDRQEAQGVENPRNTVKMLRSLVDALEQQVKLSEAINKRKDEQLTHVQNELVWTLERLQEGQKEYSKQQCVLDERALQIQGLQRRLAVANAAEAACSANAMTAAAGAAAAAQAGSTGPVARATAASAPPKQSASAEAQTQEAPCDASADVAAEQAESEEALQERLRALEVEKGRLEEELRVEQHEIAAQLHDLEGMMAALGVEGLE